MDYLQQGRSRRRNYGAELVVVVGIGLLLGMILTYFVTR